MPSRKPWFQILKDRYPRTQWLYTDRIEDPKERLPEEHFDSQGCIDQNIIALDRPAERDIGYRAARLQSKSIGEWRSTHGIFPIYVVDAFYGTEEEINYNAEPGLLVGFQTPRRAPGTDGMASCKRMRLAIGGMPESERVHFLGYAFLPRFGRKTRKIPKEDTPTLGEQLVLEATLQEYNTYFGIARKLR